MVFVQVGSSGAHLSASKGPALVRKKSVVIAVAMESEEKLNILDNNEVIKNKIMASKMCQKGTGDAGTALNMENNEL